MAKSRAGGKRAHLFIFISYQNLVNTFLTQKIIFQVVRILTGPCGWCSVHPFELLLSLFTRLFLLQTLELL